MADHATPRSFSPIAEELRELAIQRGYPHCELLNKAADELQRLWGVAEKRYWVGQRLEGVLEAAEELAYRPFPKPFNIETYTPFYVEWCADRERIFRSQSDGDERGS